MQLYEKVSKPDGRTEACDHQELPGFCRCCVGATPRVGGRHPLCTECRSLAMGPMLPGLSWIGLAGGKKERPRYSWAVR